MSTAVGPVQQPGLQVTEAEDGLIVFDPVHERVHHLNGAAALILELCNGEHPADEIEDLVATTFTHGSVTEAEVRACLEVLLAEELVV